MSTLKVLCIIQHHSVSYLTKQLILGKASFRFSSISKPYIELSFELIGKRFLYYSSKKKR